MMLSASPHLYYIAVPDPIDPTTGASLGTHQIAVTEWGDRTNSRILCCVHGLTRNSRDFDYIALALQAHYRVIAVDIAGRGKSDFLAHKQHYTYPTYVADCINVLDQLGIASVDWLGTSMGGLIGMMMAAYFPERIDRMVMNDIGPFIPSSTLQRIGKYVSITPVFTSLEQAERHLRTILAPFGITQEEHWQHLLRHSVYQQQDLTWILAYDPAIADIFTKDKEAQLQDIDLWPVWEKVTCDVLVLRGAVSDALLPETARRMQLTGPRASVVEFAHIGHAPALMEPQQITVVQQWLGAL